MLTLDIKRSCQIRTLEDIQKKGKHIFRKILSPKQTEELTQRFRCNQGIDKYTEKHSDLRKRRLELFRHTKRMEPSRHLNKFLSFMKIELSPKLRQRKRFPQ